MGQLKASSVVLFIVLLSGCGSGQRHGPIVPAENRQIPEGDPSAGGTSGAFAMPMPDTWGRTRGLLGWTEMDMTEEEVRQNASNYSFVWSSWGFLVDYFLRTNPAINVGRYTLAFQDDLPFRPELFPVGGDTAEARARSLRWWNTEADGVGHPDWVMYRCDRRTPAYHVGYSEDETYPSVPLDITNPAVIDWQIRQTVQLGARWTAVSADLVSILNFNHQCGVFRDGNWVQLFSGEDSDPAFLSAVVNWARQYRERLHTLNTPMGLVINFPMYSVYPDADIERLASNLDGLLDEQGFTAHGGFRIHGEHWLHKVRNMIRIQQLGTAFYSVNYVSPYPPSEGDANWILGSFLMARERRAYLAISTWDWAARWPHLRLFDEDVGHPCGPMRSLDGAYVREYSRALAVVNPHATDARTVTLPEGSFHDLFGHAIEGNRLELPATSGKVLLSAAVRCD